MLDHAFFSGCLVSEVSNEKRDHLFAIFRIGPPQHDGFPDSRIYDEMIFKLSRRNICAAANDHVRGSAFNEPMPLRVDPK